MTVKEVNPNIRCLEYRQDENDKDYGSCLYARFYFNLDRYELTIISDCGNYGYKWYEGKETFLHLMARVDSGYLINKIYGSANVFDYEATKENIKEYYEYVDEDEKLDKVFEFIEEDYIPETAENFVQKFEDVCQMYEFDCDNTWDCVKYTYPSDVIKICQVFENYIKPKLEELEDGTFNNG